MGLHENMNRALPARFEWVQFNTVYPTHSCGLLCSTTEHSTPEKQTHFAFLLDFKPTAVLGFPGPLLDLQPAPWSFPGSPLDFQPMALSDFKPTAFLGFPGPGSGCGTTPIIWSLNRRNGEPWRGLVQKSPVISPVGHHFTSTSPLFTRSVTKKYRIFMCLVRLPEELSLANLSLIKRGEMNERLTQPTSTKGKSYLTLPTYTGTVKCKTFQGSRQSAKSTDPVHLMSSALQQL